MRRIFFLLAGIILFHPNITAQTVKTGSAEYPEHRYYPLKGLVYTSTYMQIKGDPYLNQDWLIGTLYLKDGKNVPRVKFKFDTYAQVVIVYNDELKRLILPEENLVNSFSFVDESGERSFKQVFSDLGVRKIHSGYFLEVLHEGNIGFYKLYQKTVLPLRVPEMPFIDEFVNENRYYIFMNGNYEPARLTKVFLKQKFPMYRREISHYSHTNNLRLRSEKDFAQMISHLEQLSTTPD
jgi:hypothetical protein